MAMKSKLFWKASTLLCVKREWYGFTYTNRLRVSRRCFDKYKGTLYISKLKHGC